MKEKNFLSCLLALVMSCGVLMGLAACGPGTEKDNGSGGPVVVCEHELQRVERQEATCTEPGHIGYYTCSLCGKIFFDESAKLELTREAASIPTVSHSVEYFAAAEADGLNRPHSEYYRCFVCGKYFSDKAAETEITFSDIYGDDLAPIRLTDGTGTSAGTISHNLFEGRSYNSASQYADLYDDFVLRGFMGWTNENGLSFAEFPTNGVLQVNINLNRECTLNGTGWYNCRIRYTKEGGLMYGKMASADNLAAPEELTQLFEAQGGIYFRIVRSGGTISFYFEDADGDAQLMCSESSFGSEAIVRITANHDGQTAGWVPSVTQTALVVGVTDASIDFSSVYEE